MPKNYKILTFLSRFCKKTLFFYIQAKHKGKKGLKRTLRMSAKSSNFAANFNAEPEKL